MNKPTKYLKKYIYNVNAPMNAQSLINAPL